MEKPLLLLDVNCPHCGAGLTRDGRVHLLARDAASGNEGLLKPSALLGDPSVEIDVEVPAGTVLEVRCPDCDASLAIDAACPKCGAPCVSVERAGGGESLDLCSRQGCAAQALGAAGDPDEMFELVNRALKTPQDW